MVHTRDFFRENNVGENCTRRSCTTSRWKRAVEQRSLALLGANWRGDSVLVFVTRNSPPIRHVGEQRDATADSRSPSKRLPRSHSADSWVLNSL